MKLWIMAFAFVLLQSCSTAPEKKSIKLGHHLKDGSVAYGDITDVWFVDNYDGDTIKVNIPGVHPLLGANITVRVYGVDAPEIRTKNKCEKQKAIEAKELVKSILVKAKHITLKEVQRGKYFRILAKVYADDVDISQQLIEHKLAYPYYGDTKRKVDWCIGLQ